VEDPKKKVGTSTQEKNKKKTTELEDFISQRDYTGAIAFLEVFIEFVFLNICIIYFDSCSFAERVIQK
jgi:hypothetical protein